MWLPFYINQEVYMSEELGREALGQLGIPLLLSVLLIYYAIRLLVFKDVDSIRPAQWGRLKPEYRDKYAREAGILMLIFGLCSILSSVLMLFAIPVGMIMLTLSVIGVFYRFKRLEERYRS